MKIIGSRDEIRVFNLKCTRKVGCPDGCPLSLFCDTGTLDLEYENNDNAEKEPFSAMLISKGDSYE